MAQTVCEQRRGNAAKRKLALFARDQRGVTAIEFAFLALPFFGLLAAIMQTALVFLGSQFLESAVYDTSRLIQTGQAKNFTHAQYKAQICNRLYGLFNCSDVKLKVNTVGLNPPPTTSPIKPDGSWASDWSSPTDFEPGGGGTVVRVQAYYNFPAPLNAFEVLVKGGTAGKQLLGTSIVFINEPF